MICLIGTSLIVGTPIFVFFGWLSDRIGRLKIMSLPYHIGNGWFGDMLPLVATAIAAGTGNIYNGLGHPVIVALMTCVVGALFLRDTGARLHRMRANVVR